MRGSARPAADRAEGDPERGTQRDRGGHLGAAAVRRDFEGGDLHVGRGNEAVEVVDGRKGEDRRAAVASAGRCMVVGKTRYPPRLPTSSEVRRARGWEP